MAEKKFRPMFKVPKEDKSKKNKIDDIPWEERYPQSINFTEEQLPGVEGLKLGDEMTVELKLKLKSSGISDNDKKRFTFDIMAARPCES